LNVASSLWWAERLTLCHRCAQSLRIKRSVSDTHRLVFRERVGQYSFPESG